MCTFQHRRGVLHPFTATKKNEITRQIFNYYLWYKYKNRLKLKKINCLEASTRKDNECWNTIILLELSYKANYLTNTSIYHDIFTCKQIPYQYNMIWHLIYMQNFKKKSVDFLYSYLTNELQTRIMKCKEKYRIYCSIYWINILSIQIWVKSVWAWLISTLYFSWWIHFAY